MAEKALTTERSLADFKRAHAAKKKLIERQKEDFLFRLGKQWDAEKETKLRGMNVEPVTDNRIQPNIHLLTGLERQNRSDFKAFPEGQEDSIKAEIATHLLKHSTKQSDFGYKKSEAFEDGVTCGESSLELYLDNTFNLLNGKPCWKKIDGNRVFPEPGWKEYDYSDARYLYKLTTDLSEDDLIALFPEKENLIKTAGQGRFDVAAMLSNDERHRQNKDYSKPGESSSTDEEKKEVGFDLLERYYKKMVKTFYIGDYDTGEVKQAEDESKAMGFVDGYKAEIEQEMQMFEVAQAEYQVAASMDPNAIAPVAPAPRNPDRFKVIARMVPEIWYFAHVPGIDKPLADEKAWFYPKWKGYPIIPYFSHLSTAPIEGDDRHLLVQGIVHGVKGAQKKHNSSETLMLLHLNGAANSGWLAQEDSWVNPSEVKQFGAMPNVNLEYKKGAEKPERIFPMALSQGHFTLSQTSVDSIKAQLGIDVSLFAVEETSNESGRALALRERQRIIMVQKLFDNLARTTAMCCKFLLSQLGEMYDTETAKKVLGDAFLVKNFPPPMVLQEGSDGMPVIDPATGQPAQMPMVDPKTGQPMAYDAEMAELAIAEVLSGELAQYDVAVGEAVASETMRMSQDAELREYAQLLPGVIPPDLIIQNGNLPEETKRQILGYIKQAQAAANTVPPKDKKSAESAA